MSSRSLAAVIAVATTFSALLAGPAFALVLYRLQPAETLTSPAGESPWVEHRFADPVQPVRLLVEAWTNETVVVTATTDAGESHTFTFGETDAGLGARWLTTTAVRTLRLAGRWAEQVVVVGRRAASPDALTLGDLASCTLVLEQDVTLAANRPAATPLHAEIFTERDGFHHWSLQLRGRDVATSDRTVRAGKTFAVNNVVSTAEALVLHCADGSLFGLFSEGGGVPRSLMSITGHLTIAELNDIFAGQARFTDARGRRTEDY